MNQDEASQCAIEKTTVREYESKGRCYVLRKETLSNGKIKCTLEIISNARDGWNIFQKFDTKLRTDDIYENDPLHWL